MGTTYTPAHQGSGNDNRAIIVSTLAGMVSGDTIRFKNAANGGSDTWLVSSPTSYSDTRITDNPGGIDITISGITVQFDPNVTIYAMSGYFHGMYQCLMRIFEANDVTIIWGSGSKLKMRKSDYGTYDVPVGGYTPSEHRHCLAVIECARCTGIGAAGSHLIDSGGDGLYINGKEDTGSSALRTSSVDVVFTDVDMDNNLRQGCSIINVDGLAMKRCNFNNTIGVPPQSGIDFEPDHPRDKLKRIVLEDCGGYNNASRNMFTNLAGLDSRTAPPAWYQSDPIDITVKRGEWGGNGSADPWGLGFSMTSIDGPAAGTIRYVGLRFTNINASGIAIIRWRVDSDVKLIFDDCWLVNSASGHSEAPIQIILYNEGTGSSTGGIFFNRLVVEESIDRPIFSIVDDLTTVSPAYTGSRNGGGNCNCIHGTVLVKPNGISPTVAQYNSLYPNLLYGLHHEGIDTANRRLSLI